MSFRQLSGYHIRDRAKVRHPSAGRAPTVGYTRIDSLRAGTHRSARTLALGGSVKARLAASAALALGSHWARAAARCSPTRRRPSLRRERRGLRRRGRPRPAQRPRRERGRRRRQPRHDRRQQRRRRRRARRAVRRDGGDAQTIEIEAGSTVGARRRRRRERSSSSSRCCSRASTPSPAACSTMYFQYGDAEGIDKQVPVLDSTPARVRRPGPVTRRAARRAPLRRTARAVPRGIRSVVLVRPRPRSGSRARAR